MTVSSFSPRLAVDIGGTFTDLALETEQGRFTAKVLTTPQAPENGVLTGLEAVLAEAGLAAADVGLIIHGTTLATNALIERRGARTALIVTEGFRDSVEMAYENRFEQYDINIDRPVPLVPRHWRWPVGERVDAGGRVLRPLDEDDVAALVPRLQAEGIESVAIGLIHAYANPLHEQRIAAIIRDRCPHLALTLSSEVCPEIREYERLSTTCANAYVQPLMARYLERLEHQLRGRGFNCPFLLMTSGGGLTGLEAAVRFPIRLVESGPAGGAILASHIAARHGLDRILSYDMGGTTAKICLIDDAEPLTSRSFEVDRVYRFLKGSGLPLRIPAIEMVEIGAGGGSLARVDSLKRVTVGPESAGAEPGPACYGRGGESATVTDADVVLGRIDPDVFAGGSLALRPEPAERALAADIGSSLNLSALLAAFAVSEVVDENMANAARVHAIEWGKDLAGRTLVAFGGAAPLHAARLAEKLAIDRIVVPAGAGVGSALGFLRAAISYEVVRSRFHRLTDFDAAGANALLDEMRAEALAVVERAAPGDTPREVRNAFMRYAGQGHEISVPVPVRRLREDDSETLRQAFVSAYEQLYGRSIPGLDVEVVTWTLSLSAQPPEEPPPALGSAAGGTADARAVRPVFDPDKAEAMPTPLYWRATLPARVRVTGPALIAEEQTTTVVTAAFEAWIDDAGTLVLERRRRPGA